MIEQLFGSKTRVKLLRLFYENPNRSFYVREITRKIDEQINSVRRELANLLSIGIITSDTTNNKLYYEVNQSFEHYDALSAIFGGRKKKVVKKGVPKTQATEAIEESSPPNTETEDSFAAAVSRTGNLRLLVYTGQFTLDGSPGVDIVLVGDFNHAGLESVVQDLERSEKKVLRYSVFHPDEFMYRKQVNDRFVSNLMLAKKIVVVDKDNVL